MKKLNLLSKDEIRNVMGGIIDGATLEEVCKNWIGGRTYDGSDEDLIMMGLIENHCWNFTREIPF
jgi:hypothetical protein